MRLNRWLEAAKVYGLVDKSYSKMGDFPEESQAFQVGESRLEMDFGRLWARKRGMPL